MNPRACFPIFKVSLDILSHFSLAFSNEYIAPIGAAFSSPIPFQMINKSVSKQMSEQKYAFLTSDPENCNGHDLIRQKFGIAPPNQFKYGRAQGGISNIELEKLGIG